VERTFVNVNATLDVMESELTALSRQGALFPFEIFAGRTVDTSSSPSPLQSLLSPSRSSPAAAHTVVASAGVTVPVSDAVSVLCGPVVGKVAVDGAIVMLEVDAAAVVTAFAVPEAALDARRDAVDVGPLAVARDTAILPACHPRVFRLSGLQPNTKYKVCHVRPLGLRSFNLRVTAGCCARCAGVFRRRVC
jgi:hypothetical protein